MGRGARTRAISGCDQLDRPRKNIMCTHAALPHFFASAYASARTHVPGGALSLFPG